LSQLVDHPADVQSENEAEIHCMMLYGFSLVAYEELGLNGNRDDIVIESCFSVILEHLYTRSVAIITAACECLSAFLEFDNLANVRT
jgi:hypothetical protein